MTDATQLEAARKLLSAHARVTAAGRPIQRQYYAEDVDERGTGHLHYGVQFSPQQKAARQALWQKQGGKGQLASRPLETDVPNVGNVAAALNAVIAPALEAKKAAQAAQAQQDLQAAKAALASRRN